MRLLTLLKSFLLSCFNPRTPGGVRLSLTMIPFFIRCFNPRTPGGVRLSLKRNISLAFLFQSTHPGRGATPIKNAHIKNSHSFNPRTPGGVRHLHQFRRGSTSLVSIHAPRAGCDDTIGQYTGLIDKFQSTHPGRGATLSHFGPRRY